ncbi:MAG: sigma-54-dependent Fis family transcriptional regulator [Ignavibacteriales bacterium]|nr:sigma-54-dependent Fis family transcriptional regulator [Ignavibacteriales bacterium]
MAKQNISILAVDDEEPFLELLKSLLEEEGFYVNTANDGVAAINVLQTLPFDLVLLDLKMPRVDGVEVLKFIKDHFFDTQVIMLTGVSDVKLAVECMQLGAYYYITKPYSSTELLAVIDRAFERKRLVTQNKALKSELARHALSSHIVGQSKPFLEVLNLASRVAPTDSSVLIQGASGTGKELVASFLHNNSLRKEQPFMALNCASIPETLIESELFGHEKGAFTDAVVAKQGLVEIANGGTLFLDEVAEISLMVQPKLLRFLQTGEFRRVGGNKNMKADVRLVSATNKDLRKEVAAGRFREDLLYRLNVITLGLPSLRERKDDIPILVDYFLKNRLRGKEPRQVAEQALEILMKYDWPGNVRELENVIERAAILCLDNVIRVDDLALPIGTRSLIEPFGLSSGEGTQIGSAVPMVEIEKAHMKGVLKTVNWNKNVAAKILGISLKTLYTKIQQYNLSKD